MAPPSLAVMELKAPQSDHRLFRLSFFRTTLTVTVTSKAEAIRRWIRNVCHHSRRYLRLHRLIVGLSLGDELNDTISTIHLCVGRFCLIIQLHHLINRRGRLGTPPILQHFFSNPKIKFVGISNEGHDRKLEKSGIKVVNIYDLKNFLLDENENAKSYKAIVKEAMETEFDLDPDVTYSNWKKPDLDDKQISQAAADAYVRSKIGVKFVGNM